MKRILTRSGGLLFIATVFVAGALSAMSPDWRWIGLCGGMNWEEMALRYMNKSETHACEFCDQIVALAQEKGSLKLDAIAKRWNVPIRILVTCSDRYPNFAGRLNGVLPGQDRIVLPAATASLKEIIECDAHVVVKLMAARPEIVKPLFERIEKDHEEREYAEYNSFY